MARYCQVVHCISESAASRLHRSEEGAFDFYRETLSRRGGLSSGFATLVSANIFGKPPLFLLL